MSDAATDLLLLRATQVFVVGDALLDAYVSGIVERVSPEAPVPVVHENRPVRHVLGGAANVAAGIAALGATAWLSARIGDDEDGAILTRLLQTLDIDARAVIVDETVPTITKTRVLAGAQQVVRIDREVVRALSPAQAERVLADFHGFLEATAGRRRALVLTDYAKGMLSADLVELLIAAARDADVPVVADPKDPDLRRFAGATVLKPNLLEGRAAAARAGAPTDDIDAILGALLQASDAENVVLSLSGDGVAVAGNATGATVRLHSRALDVADVSGAGDTMVAVLALGIGAQLDLVRVVNLANIAAGCVCAKLGTATLSSSEMLAAVREQAIDTEPEKWLSSRDVAAEIMATHRSDGRRIVFTNGCFDVVHAGHVRLLQAARALGDILVVGLNSDASVSRLKGPARPVCAFDDRRAVLAALSCVDFVVEFEEDTPLELILALRPTLVVKGGDYRPQDVVGGAEAAAWGGSVAIIPLLEGRSTTRILEAGGAG